MFLLISTGTFLALATLALIVWAGLVLVFTGRSKAKKHTRPAPAIKSFFQPTAGKIAVDVPFPMASYDRTELIPLRTKASTNTSEAILAPETPTASTSSSESVPPVLDDPAFAPADPDEETTSDAAPDTASVLETTNVLTYFTDTIHPSPTGFRLSLDRQLLSRLLSDDSLCQEFEAVRALTLDRQRDTGRSYASLFREAVADKPADVQAMLLNLLDEDEADDYDHATPGFA